MTGNLREGSPGTKLGDESTERCVKPAVGSSEAAETRAVQAPDSNGDLFLGREQHEAAAIYPLMQDEAFDGLCESLREIGLADPIVLHDGKVLEGRNRCRAIERLRAEGCEVEVQFVEWKPKGDETPHDYVVAVNSNRRHLTPDQQAAAACKYLPFLREQSGKRQAETRFKAGSQAVAKKSESPQKRDSRAKNANSTAGQLAAKFGISQHMANQAVALEKAVSKGKLPPAAIDEVLNGTKISKVLARVEAERSPPTPRVSQTRQPLGIHLDDEALATRQQEFAGTPLDPAALWGKPAPKAAECVDSASSGDLDRPRLFSVDDLEEEVQRRWAEFLDGFPAGYVPRVEEIVAGILKPKRSSTTSSGPRRRCSKRAAAETGSSDA